MKRRLLHVFLLILVLVILTFTPPGGDSIFRLLGRLFWDSGRGIISTIENTGYLIKEWGEVIFLLKTLVKERNILMEKAEELKTSKLNIERLKEENKSLLELLEFRTITSEINTLGVRVIGQDTLSVSQTLIIDKGSKDGISEGSLLLYGGAVVGKVKKVNENTSAVVLLDNHEFTLGGIVESTGELGIVKGGPDKLLFEFLSLNPRAIEGDVIITSYDEGFGGIIIGKIYHLDRQSKITPEAEIKPIVDPQRTRYFLVTLIP